MHSVPKLLANKSVLVSVQVCNVKKLLMNTVSLSRGVRADDKKGGSGARNWGTARDDLRYNIFSCHHRPSFSGAYHRSSFSVH